MVGASSAPYPPGMSRPKKRRGGRVTPKQTRPRNWDDPGPSSHRGGPAPDELPLLAEIREALSAGHPLGLLALGSTFAELATDAERPRSMLSDEPGSERPQVTWEMIVDMLSATALPETTALLHALVLFAPPPWDSHLRVELEQRRLHQLPGWVRTLDEVEVTQVWEQVDVLGDGENVLLGLRWSTGDELTVVLYIDHNIGGLIKDFISGLGDAEEILTMFEAEAEAGSSQRRIDPADARARIESAVQRWSMTWPPVLSDEWPVARPLVQWVASKLPEGGVMPTLDELSDEDRDRLIDSFLGSPDGDAHRDDPDVQTLLGATLWFGADHGVCDPLKWSPVRVELLLTDFIPRKLLVDAETLAKLPELLVDFLPWALRALGDRDGIDRQVIDERIDDALEALDHWAPQYLMLVDADPDEWDGDVFGDGSAYEMARAILAEAGDDFDPEARERLESFVALGPDPSERDYLLYELGGEEAAAAVHDDPWPLEPVDLARVPDDVQEKVTEIDEQLVAVCTRLSLEPEHITIARRLLVRVAERDPQALRRRGAIGGWVAGLIVVVGDMNRLIGQRHGQVTKKAIAEAAGVKSVGDKDITIGRAAQLMSAYHHVDLLDSRARQHLLELLAGYED